MSSAAKYQRHVDGLRAVAVLAVILYHCSHRWFRGGYGGSLASKIGPNSRV